MHEITVALISGVSSIIVGGLTLVGVVITNSKANRKIEKQLEIAQAVTNEKVQELTREVREHNNFAVRIPVLEEKMKVVNNRIADLEEFHKGV